MRSNEVLSSLKATGFNHLKPFLNIEWSFIDLGIIRKFSLSYNHIKNKFIALTTKFYNFNLLLIFLIYFALKHRNTCRQKLKYCCGKGVQNVNTLLLTSLQKYIATEGKNNYITIALH